MAGVNKVLILGRLGQDPEVKYMPNGKAVCNLRVATSEAWKDKQTGEKKEATEWHSLTLYERLAEIAGEFLHKGSQAFFEGKLHTRKWQDRDGKDRYTTEIIVRSMQMLDGKPAGDRPAQAAQPATTEGAPFDDSIPF